MTIEFLGPCEAEAPDVVWSGQANDDSVLALVKRGAVLDSGVTWYSVLWYVTREWARVDGTARQLMFEHDTEESDAFGQFTDQNDAVNMAKAALTEHCGKEWS